MDINGTADFCGTIYAPNAAVKLNGTAGVFGAIICNTITVGGIGDIHYDVQLAGAVSAGGPDARSWLGLRDRPRQVVV